MEIRSYIYNLARNSVKDRLTAGLGRIVEKDDKIICYVDKRKCLKTGRYTYDIPCREIDECTKNLASSYGLNKPICYIIEGIDFGKCSVNIFGYNNASVIIRNCKFNYELFISVDGNCVFENNYVRPLSHRLMIGACKITIKNMYIYNELKYALNIDIGADFELNIINSNIGRLCESTDVSLIAGDKLVLDNSDIRGDRIECISNEIVNHHGSCLTASKAVNVKAVVLEPIKVTSPEIIVNGNKVDSKEKTVILKQETNLLSLKRVELIELLKLVKDKCEMTNSKDLEKYEEELKNRTICRTLNRK